MRILRSNFMLFYLMTQPLFGGRWLVVVDCRGRLARTP